MSARIGSLIQTNLQPGGRTKNYQIGFVDVTDTPYPIMTKHARQLAEQMYRIGTDSPDVFGRVRKALEINIAGTCEAEQKITGDVANAANSLILLFFLGHQKRRG